MKILDRYIIKNFLTTFFFILGIIMVLAIIVDLVEKMDDFVSITAPFKEIVLDYYVNFTLFYMNMFAGLITFIAVLFFTSRLAQRTEIIAILSSAVSFPRLCYPYFLAATFLTIISLCINHLILPNANATRLEFEEAYLRNAFHIKGKNHHREIEPGTIAYFEDFYHDKNMGYRFSLEKWSDDSLEFKLLSNKAYYDTLTGSWNIQDYFIREFKANGRSKVRTGVQMDTIIPLEPGDLGQRLTAASSMGYRELNAFIDEKMRQGSDQVKHFLIEKHQRTAVPFATYIFTLMGISIASRKTRGGTGVHIFLGLMLTFTYIFSMRVTAVAATNAGLSPLLAVWIPNIIFFMIAVWMYRRAPK